jgi:hypothetical protein
MKLWKIQKFASDVVYDLRSRNLLLVAVLLIVAIVAVPIMITRGGSGSGSPPPPSLAAQTGGSASAENQSAVLAYSPAGLRNYKQRLNDLAAKNPFKQQFTGPGAASASALNQATSAVTGSSGSSTPGLQATEIIPGVGGGSGSGNTGSSGAPSSGGGTTKVVTKTKTKYVSYQTDVQVGESGQPLTALNKIPQFAFLPNPQLPVLVFLGTSSGGSQAIFMVAKDVVSVGGDGLCYPSQDACQLLALNAGKGADLIYGIDHKTYHLQVTSIKKVVTSKPPH